MALMPKVRRFEVDSSWAAWGRNGGFQLTLSRRFASAEAAAYRLGDAGMAVDGVSAAAEHGDGGCWV